MKKKVLKVWDSVPLWEGRRRRRKEMCWAAKDWRELLARL